MKADSPTLQVLAGAYGVSAEAMSKLQRKRQLDRATLADPDKLFEVLVNSDSREGRIRRAISDPAKRREILSKINEQ